MRVGARGGESLGRCGDAARRGYGPWGEVAGSLERRVGCVRSWCREARGSARGAEWVVSAIGAVGVDSLHPRGPKPAPQRRKPPAVGSDASMRRVGRLHRGVDSLRRQHRQCSISESEVFTVGSAAKAPCLGILVIEGRRSPPTGYAGLPL